MFNLLAYYLKFSFEITFLILSQCIKRYRIKFRFFFWPLAANTWNSQNCGESVKEINYKKIHHLLEIMYFILRDGDTSINTVTSVPAGLLRSRGSTCGRGKSGFSSERHPNRFWAYPSSYSIATDSFPLREWSWPFTSIY